MNYLGSRRIPFLFIVDYECADPVVIPLAEIDESGIIFDINGFSNSPEIYLPNRRITLVRHPVHESEYRKAFDRVIDHEKNGDTYLLNLTFPTRIEINISLREIFHRSVAKYRLLFRDRFVVFSPETFVRIEGTFISTHPMKGTIDASIPDAESVIMSDEKETAEHLTIVDMLRNDLSAVSRNVTVRRFRYIDRIMAGDSELLQVSSEITGELEPDFNRRIGNIIHSMLPAGSVTGAPKKITVDIIKSIENGPRGFYTGVFGIFDGYRLDSGVMIRFIENRDGTYFFRSGGGITVYSNPESEYAELIRKVYVPVV